MNDASGRLCSHAEEDRKSFRSTPELDEEGGAITDVTADGNRYKLLTSSEQKAVAKFSSFRQLRVSTIRRFSSVTGVTLPRDANQ